MNVPDDEISEVDGREQAYGLGRMLALSDGVFAFALTLLVVQLSVPTVPGGRDSGALASALLAQGPRYFSYLLSFAAIAMSWYGHHENFKYIRRYDGRLIALNFGLLAVVAMLPFPSALLGQYGIEPVAAAFYAVVLALLGLFATATWWYATNGRRLVADDLPDQIVRFRLYRALSTVGIFLLTLPLALWMPNVAEVGWALVWIGVVLFWRRDGGRVAARKR